MRIQTQHGALLVDSSHPVNYVHSFGPWPFSRVGVGSIEGVKGLGAQLPQDQAQMAGIAATAVTTTTSLVVAHMVAIGAMAGPVGALVGAAVGGLVAIGYAIANAFAGCGQTCVRASQIANEVETILAQNLEHYLSSPIHYRSLQQAALSNFDIAWGALSSACSDPALTQAGVNCIEDRQQGSCKWKTSPAGWKNVNGKWEYAGAGQAGTGDSCWNWFVGYRDPIANDPTVVPDPQSFEDGTLQDAMANQQTAIPGGSAVAMFGQDQNMGGFLDNFPSPLLFGAGGLALLLFLTRKR